MKHTETTGRHPSEDDLVLYHYREAPKRGAIESHLEACETCRGRYEALQRALAAVGSLSVPEPDDGFEARMWQRVEPGLATANERSWRSLFSPARLALAGAMAVLVVLAFVAGRQWPRSATPGSETTAVTAAAASDSVLFIAVIDHLDRSERALTELVNTAPGSTIDISTEQGLARELVPANRLIRQSACEVGEAGMASLLDDLERVLLEVAHSPSKVSSAQFNEIRDRIESQGLIFKVRVLGSDVRERQVEAVRALARQRS